MVAPHIHSNAREWNTVIQGTGRVVSYGVDGGEYASRVNPGDSFMFPQGSVHYWVNDNATSQLVTVGGFSASVPTASLVNLQVRRGRRGKRGQRGSSRGGHKDIAWCGVCSW